MQLNEHIESLSECLMQPWLNKECFQVLRQAVEGLVEVMRSYSKYITDKSESVNQCHHSEEPVQKDDNASLQCIPCSSGLVPSEYVDLEEKLRLSSLCEPVLVNEFAPQDRIQ